MQARRKKKILKCGNTLISLAARTVSIPRQLARRTKFLLEKGKERKGKETREWNDVE
jgi:hypothetical protein